MIRDLSDAGLVAAYGDIMHELPELYEAIRHYEMQNRPRLVSGGFRIRADWVSVNCADGNVSRIGIRNPGRVE
nr:hypothetical protein RKHAN_02540 [Rhizobium sp. Khangiran2]